MIKIKAQSTVEYVLFAGVLILAVLSMLSKAGMSRRIAQVYDDSGDIMSRNAGRSNSGQASVTIVDPNHDPTDPTEQWTEAQKAIARDISMAGVYTWDQCVERCKEYYGRRPRDWRRCTAGAAPLCNIFPME